MTSNDQLFKSSMKYGLYYAIISIVISLIIWATKFIENSGLTANFIVSAINIVVWVLILIYFTKDYRDKTLGGVIDFKQAFFVGMLTVAFASLIIAVYNFSFHSWIDPEYSQRTIDAIIEKTYNMMSGMGLPESEIENSLKAIETMEVPTPVQSTFSGLQQNIIYGAVLALISAAIVKKNKDKSGFAKAMDEINDEE
ncbi:MAG: DUF4199 domain-containing protein [Prolixibacteraceae bacterium]|nr:DUF4199 domain-containing protein [Prolixibacteraceae bacterium]